MTLTLMLLSYQIDVFLQKMNITVLCKALNCVKWFTSCSDHSQRAFVITIHTYTYWSFTVVADYFSSSWDVWFSLQRLSVQVCNPIVCICSVFFFLKSTSTF